jgi:hypothetical protein
MLRFESVFWATKNKSELIKKLSALGFSVGPSQRDPLTQCIYFGPETIEIFSQEDSLSTLNEVHGVEEFLSKGDGIFGIGLESNHITNDYRRIQKLAGTLGKPRQGKDIQGKTEAVPLWTGFTLPEKLTPLVKAWAVMNSNDVLRKQGRDILPATHTNSAFGIEAIHLTAQKGNEAALAWGSLVQKHVSGLKWNELEKSEGHRLQVGERFFDVIDSKPSLAQSAHSREGVFMLTIKVRDLEGMTEMAKKAGATPLPCSNRDGFLVASEFTGGPTLRFVRSAWKKYMPVLTENYPYGRRTDHFRPLGGADSTTLIAGFEDNWKY